MRRAHYKFPVEQTMSIINSHNLHPQKERERERRGADRLKIMKENINIQSKKTDMARKRMRQWR